jgi:hypothetical protein
MELRHTECSLLNSKLLFCLTSFITLGRQALVCLGSWLPSPWHRHFSSVRLGYFKMKYCISKLSYSVSFPPDNYWTNWWVFIKCNFNLKSSVFWDITLYSLAEVNQHFGGATCLLPVSCWFLLWLIPQPWRWRQYAPLKTSCFTRLYGTISSKTELFKMTTTRSSNLTRTWCARRLDAHLYFLNFLPLMLPTR